MSMELIGYDVTFDSTGLHKITLDCIGSENDLETIRDVYYNPGFYQVIGLSNRPCKKELDHAKEQMKAYILGTNNEKENKTMNKETKTFTAEEFCRIEKEAYNRGYDSGRKAGIIAVQSTYRFAWNDKELIPKIKKVIFNDPATIVFWADGTKTVAKAHGDDKFDKEVGLTVCIAKKALGNRSNFDKVFKKWIK